MRRWLQTFFTAGHSNILAAFKVVVAFKNQLLIDILIPLLNNQAIVAYDYTCLLSTASISSALLEQVPNNLRVEVCSAGFGMAVTSGNAEILQVLVDGGADVNMPLTNEEYATDLRTARHWIGMYGLR